MLADFSCLPDDIIYILANFLKEEDIVDAYTLMLLSRRTYAVVLPIIYSSVCLRNYHQCVSTLDYLQRYPYVASYILTLSVAPRDRTLNSDSKSRSEMETKVAHILEQLAPDLKRMVDFRWDGSCMPKPTTFWHTLQRECQDLAYVGTSISHMDSFSWDETTSFLQLRNLRGLSVVIKTSPDNLHGFTSTLPHQFLSRFPPSFWEIIHPSRSPKLRSLSFEGDILRSFDFNPLFNLKLPSLRALVIGAFVFSDFSSTDLVSFLAFTSKMEHLEISPVSRVPWQDINFDQLRHYGGNVYSVISGAAHWSSLRSLDISCFPLSFVRMTNFVQKSSKLPLLKFLKLRVTSEDTIYSHSCSKTCGESDPSLGLVPALACCYPGLEEFHMISSVGSTLPWDSILLSLGRFQNLERFHLSQAPPRLGPSTLQVAMAALSSNSKIEQVVIWRSAGPWQKICDCKIDEKVTVKYLNRQSQMVTVHQTHYIDGDYVSSSRFLLSKVASA